jgi:hypothetical protein
VRAAQGIEAATLALLLEGEVAEPALAGVMTGIDDEAIQPR